MFFRYFALLCFIGFFAVGIQVSQAEEEIEERAGGGAAAKAVAKIIGSLFAGAAASCIGEAAAHCKSHWKHPSAALKCGKEFLKNNKGKCATGK